MKLSNQLKRITQQYGQWSNVLNKQNFQFCIIKKLYLNNGFEIKMTSCACPEQYEVFKDGEQVAYYRLRHGEFRIDYPKCGQETIYTAYPNGDGVFDDYERLIYLSKAMKIIINKLEL